MKTVATQFDDDLLFLISLLHTAFMKTLKHASFKILKDAHSNQYFFH